MRKEVISENALRAQVVKKEIRKDIRASPWIQEAAEGERWGVTSAQEKHISGD